MLLKNEIKESNSIKTPVYASLALAFASFGDAFLYPFLPVNTVAAGVSVIWVGVLLSVNRFVRIFSNAWMVHLFSHYGMRFITIIAVILAITSTAGYALASGVLLWLVLRIMWGLSFSAMRISTLGYAIQQPRQGFALGLTRGIQESGPMIALLIAPLLIVYFDTVTIFIVLAALSLPALYFAINLPVTNDKTSSVTRTAFVQFPSVLNSITFISAFIIDGIIVIVLGVLFLQYKENISLVTATSLAALYLGYRRICLVIFSPAGGWLSDKIGLNKIFRISLTAVIIGLIVLTSGRIEFGALIIFTFYSIHAAITPGNVSNQHTHPLAAVAENATWRDLGAAVGTMAGGFLLTSDYLTSILIFAIFSLTLLILLHWGAPRRALKLLYLWK